jgi:hypothetical protein
MLKTHFPLKLNSDLSNTLYCEANLKEEEETLITLRSSPSPQSPASSPQSSAEETAVPSSPAPPELPEILSLCQRLNPSIEDLNKKKISAAEFMNVLVRELTPFIIKNAGPKKTIKKKKEKGFRRCSLCLTETTPEWRRDLEGLVTLCNACGLKVKKKARTAPTTATTSPSLGQRFHTFQQNKLPATIERRSPQVQVQPQRSPQKVPAPVRRQYSPYVLPPVPQVNTSAATYQPYHAYKIEENNSHQTYNPATYHQVQVSHQENVLPMNIPVQYQYYYNDDSFPYQPSPQNYQHFHPDDDLQNCSECFIHYAAY